MNPSTRCPISSVGSLLCICCNCVRGFGLLAVAEADGEEIFCEGCSSSSACLEAKMNWASNRTCAEAPVTLSSKSTG